MRIPRIVPPFIARALLALLLAMGALPAAAHAQGRLLYRWTQGFAAFVLLRQVLRPA